jgi:hypothetical protein
MNARARGLRAIDAMVDMVRYTGGVGERWFAADVARSLDVPTGEVTHWIREGWLRASRIETPGGVMYRIRRRALRRAIMDYPQVSKAIMRAQLEKGLRDEAIEAQRKRSAG